MGKPKTPLPIDEHFSDKKLFQIITHMNTLAPWYADNANYLATSRIPSHWSSIDRKKFFRNVRYFSREDPYSFKYCPDQIIRWCVPDDEVKNI